MYGVCKEACVCRWNWREEVCFLAEGRWNSIRTLIPKQLKLLKEGILHIHLEGKLIKTARDRRLRSLCFTPYVSACIDTSNSFQSFLSLSFPSELSGGRRACCEERHDKLKGLDTTVNK